MDAENEAAWSSVFTLHRATRLVLDGVLCGSFETAKIYAAGDTVNEMVEVPERWGLPPKLGSLLLGMNAEAPKARRVTVAAFLDQQARDDARSAFFQYPLPLPSPCPFAHARDKVEARLTRRPAYGCTSPKAIGGKPLPEGTHTHRPSGEGATEFVGRCSAAEPRIRVCGRPVAGGG